MRRGLAPVVKKAGDRALSPRAPVPPIVMGAPGRSARSRAETALRLLLRLVAVVWLLEGGRQWVGVLTGPSTVYLPAAPPLHVAGLFFFLVLDFVAAVGLWLVASWGVAVWLATVAGHVLALVLAPGFLADPMLLALGDAVFVGLYAGLALEVARQQRLA